MLFNLKHEINFTPLDIVRKLEDNSNFDVNFPRKRPGSENKDYEPRIRKREIFATIVLVPISVLFLSVSVTYVPQISVLLTNYLEQIARDQAIRKRNEAIANACENIKVYVHAFSTLADVLTPLGTEVQGPVWSKIIHLYNRFFHNNMM